jgi:hypothetical protein
MRTLLAAVLGADVALKEAFKLSRMAIATGFGLAAAGCCIAAIAAQRHVAEIEDGERVWPASSSRPGRSSATSTRAAAAAA